MQHCHVSDQQGRDGFSRQTGPLSPAVRVVTPGIHYCPPYSLASLYMLFHGTWRSSIRTHPLITYLGTIMLMSPASRIDPPCEDMALAKCTWPLSRRH